MNNGNHILRTLATALVVGLMLSVTSCGPGKSTTRGGRINLNDGATQKVQLVDNHSWVQAHTRILVESPEGNQRFKAQIRSKKDSILWVAISDDLIGLRVGKAVVYDDSAAFSSTLLGIKWSGSSSDLADMVGIEMPFEYLDEILRGQLIGVEEPLKFRYNGFSQKWTVNYHISDSRSVEALLNTKFQLVQLRIIDAAETVTIKYEDYDEVTGYPQKLTLSLLSNSAYKVRITVSDYSTEGPYHLPFKFD